MPALSVGTYSIPANGKDDQLPHFEDEVYVVTAGRAMFRGGSGDPVAVGPGRVLFVGAGRSTDSSTSSKTCPWWSSSPRRTARLHPADPIDGSRRQPT